MELYRIHNGKKTCLTSAMLPQRQRGKSTMFLVNINVQCTTVDT